MADPISLSLGLLPIVASIIKQYSSVHSFCQRFRHHKSGIEELLSLVRRQEVIFNNETRILLASVVGTDRAITMLKNVNHPDWAKESIIQRIQDTLGETRHELESAADEVLMQINKLNDELSGTDTFTGRIKFSASENKFNSIGKSLREATKDYRTLRQQIQELVNQKPVIECESEKSCDLPRLQTIQTAAKHVYEKLSTACKRHTCHHAHLSLKPVYNATGLNAEVRFQIAYRHLSKQQATTNGDVLWFVVESSINGAILSPPMSPCSSEIVSSNAQPGKRQRKHSDASECSTSSRLIKASSKRVRFRSRSPNIRSLPSLQFATINHVPDLCITADLCRKLLTAHKKSSNYEACIGFLEDSGTWKHRVYRSQCPAQRTAITSSPHTKALVELLMQKNNMDRSDIPMTPRQRLLIARSLAAAMLDYTSTPWMQKTWRSSDIILYNAEPQSRLLSDSTMPELFVEVPIHGEKNPSDDPDRSSFDSPLVRNSTLFSLGVMLIELGFEKPLHTMLKPCDSRHPATPPLERDWNAATRLSKEVGTNMGMKFSKIVEQCLFCVFGHGTKLENVALQDAVYRDVVTELDVLIEGFSRL